MSLSEWRDRQSEKRVWSIRLEFGLVATLVLGSLLLSVASLIWAAAASAHPGGLAADGCHNDRKNGGRHCHRASTTQTKPRQPTRGDVYYANCTAARAAGAAPVRKGDPGYARHLDRDGDGVGCE
ncbi:MULTISPECIES: excalibur calcium-binding domain-containing protein [Qipengyuania]|uniref:excalibur calcium-binding domain-containing protein n=1 Tax=Qipengyuania TaxID=1855416 RepID=UPI001FFE0142|nr:excalibur calcium-binding domain-containing protein [Qipengyuania flava]